ncbi:MAG: prolipoprotein diacylglyceryl transferase [Bacteroidales bacterium]|nr:prolipoprotein diacylglyceryl transferase [Bacteroidales bacterium]
MFPKLSDLLVYLFGVHINLPIQTYGFFMACAFMVAAWILWLELKRKEKEGLITSRTRMVWKGRPASSWELVSTGLLGFIIGYKIIGMVVDYADFSDNPQEYVLSGQGNWIGGIVLGALSAYSIYRKKNKQKLDKPVKVQEIIHPYQLTASIVLVAAVFGIIGSKVFDVFEHLEDLAQDPMGTLFSFSGLTFYGGLIVAAFAVSIYAEKNNIPWPHIADAVAPALILAYAIGRIGCQLSGDGCWGIENPDPKPGWMGFLPDWMWAFDFPHNVINEGGRISNCTGDHCHALNVPVYPTSFYETMMGCIIFLVIWLTRGKWSVPGYLFSFYLILNGIERFLIEFIRVNRRYQFLGVELSQAQWIAIGLILLGIAGFWFFKRKSKGKEQKSNIKS